jgi:hypothetical protein
MPRPPSIGSGVGGGPEGCANNEIDTKHKAERTAMNLLFMVMVII